MKYRWSIGVDDDVFAKWFRSDSERLSCYDDDCLESSLWIDRALDHLNDNLTCTDVKYTQRPKMGFNIYFTCDELPEGVHAALMEWKCGHYHTLTVIQK